MTSRPRLAISMSVLVLAAACGGGGGDEDAATTTVPAATTAAAITSSSAGDEVTTTEESTTTTEVIVTGPRAPLTGLIVDEVLDRPVLAVKIDNHENARPQKGINQADIVYEEVVEGITRLVGIFQSVDSDPVGPVRSARTTDVRLLAHLSVPLFANSGGNSGTLRQVNSSPNLINMNVNKAPGEFFRDNSGGRFAPHNLFTNTSALLARAPETSTAPASIFHYRLASTEIDPTLPKITSFSLNMGHQVTYTWDEETGGWLRVQNGTAHVDDDGVQVAPPNVIVMETRYGTSAADPNSPEAIVTGSGELFVFTEGVLIQGTWSRDEITDIAVLIDLNGDTIEITPGRTWVALPKPGRITINAAN